MTEFETVLLLDDRLKTSDKCRFGVMKGAMNIDQRHQMASSASSSSLQWTVQTPNMITYVDRRVLWRQTTTFKIVGTPVAGAFLFPYGSGCALSPFPNHQQCSNMTAVINSAATSIEIQDELPQLVKLYDDRHLMSYNSMCPYLPDRYADYDDAMGSVANPLGGYGNSADYDLMPRGAFPVEYSLDKMTWGALYPLVAGTGSASQTLYVRFTSTEPLMISPFTWLEKDASAIYGVATLNFNFTVSPSLLSRLVRYSDVSYVAAGSPAITYDNSTPFTDSFLDFNFLTGHSSLLQTSRNIVPYYNLNRQNMLNNAQGLTALNITPLICNTISLSNIPDEVIIVVRPVLSGQTYTTPDFFFPIRKVNITFANKSGLLANCTTQDLFQISKKNYCSSNWLDFSGVANAGTTVITTGGAPTRVLTGGSVFVAAFGRDIPLSSDFEAPSLKGQYQFQVNLDVYNPFTTQQNVEVIAIFKSSGVIVTELGVSNMYVGVLTMEQVMRSSTEQESHSWSSSERLIGGNIFSNLKSKFLEILPKIPSYIKNAIKDIDNPYAKAATAGLEAFGYGQSGGAMLDGGKLRRRIKQ
jgi:hypothetical protein